jgi:tetratricopeptide (TPR) repeat protein
MGIMVKLILLIMTLTCVVHAGDESVVNGNFYYENARYDDALFFYDKHLSKNPNDAKILFMKGKCLFFQKKYSNALTIFWQVESIVRAKKDPTAKPLYGIDYYIVRCLINTGKIDKRILLNIDNSPDKILAEARYLRAYATDSLLPHTDSYVVKQYEKVLDIYPQHKASRKRIKQIKKGLRAKTHD